MDLSIWAKKWNLPQEALTELQILLTGKTSILQIKQTESEASIKNKIRLEASSKGARLWINNVGAFSTINGDFVRYGLANESSRQNKHIKSSDLIGIKPIEITQEHLGLKIGQFLCREVKRSNWRYADTEHEKAQLNWIRLINSLGGDAAFVTSTGSI
jgi:hypothetical protein